MSRILVLFFLGLALCLMDLTAYAQDPGWSSELDSLRAQEDQKPDTLIYSSRYVRYTTRHMMRQGTYTFQIDTTHQNFQYYNPQNQPHNPSINLGSYGLATRDLLFNPNKTIGFQSGHHAFERYLYRADSVRYYRARAPYSELYNIGFFFDDQQIRATVAQNITPGWNVGGEFHGSRAQGFYQNQGYGDIKWALFSWYESNDHRYNLLFNTVSNRLTATENGSILNDTVFRDEEGRSSDAEFTRLKASFAQRPTQIWRDNHIFLRQSLYLGRLDTVNRGLPEQQIFPTNRFFHSLDYKTQQFTFFKNEADVYGAFPLGQSVLTQDSTLIQAVTNEFGYSFFLRSKSLRNEVKLDLGYQHDMHWIQGREYSSFLQDNTLKAGIGYQFSDRISLQGDFQQIVQGQHFGDYLYEVKASLLLSNEVGRLDFGAYTQNKSPEYLFNRVNYTYHQWEHDFDKTKTTNLSFSYINDFLGFKGTASYFLITNHLYFREVDNPTYQPDLFRVIEPTQFGTNINLLKLSATHQLKWNSFHFDNHAVYQRSDFNAVLAIPDLYTWHSLYFNGNLNQAMDFNIGLDVRFNTPFQNPSYAINVAQFYNDNAKINFSTYPIVDVWTTATLKRVNLFLSYNFLNQHLWPRGYYTVRRYPMYNANFRLGVRWKFYD